MELDPDPTAIAPPPDVPAPTDVRQRVAVQPDVLLDAVVSVQEIKLDVRGLKANVRVNAEVANLVKLSVGADVSLDRVTLTITGVEVKALLEVRLDEVHAILDRALTLLIEHPEILEVLARTLVDVVHEVGEVVAPVVEGVVSGVVAPVVQGVVGQLVAPVVDGVVRALNPPAAGPAPGGGDVAAPPVVQPVEPPPVPGGAGDVAAPPVLQPVEPPPVPGGAGVVAAPPVVQPVEPPPVPGGAVEVTAPPVLQPVEPPPVPGGAGDVAPPPVVQQEQPADQAPRPITDHSGPFLKETLSEADPKPRRAPAVGQDSDGVLERAIRLLSLLDKGDT